jgi:hypothetical protein
MAKPGIHDSSARSHQQTGIRRFSATSRLGLTARARRLVLNPAAASPRRNVIAPDVPTRRLDVNSLRLESVAAIGDRGVAFARRRTESSGWSASAPITYHMVSGEVVIGEDVDGDVDRCLPLQASAGDSERWMYQMVR